MLQRCCCYSTTTLTITASATRSLRQQRRRRIWTAKTVVSSNADDLLSALPQPEHHQDSNAAIFSISRSVPGSVLGTLVKHFQDFPVTAIGCLTHGNEDGSAPYSLSYAIHKSRQNQLELVVPFRSNIKGIPKTALGREVSRREKKVHDAEWAGDDSVVAEDLPEELQSLDSSLISEVIYFADHEPQGLMKSLDANLPAAQKLGLLASSTPFVTGRPYSMIKGSSIHSDGAVGIAVCRYPARKDSDTLRINYEQLDPLGEALKVTSSKGNIILELGSANATKLLLERIQHSLPSIDKEQGFYLGILPPGKTQATLQEMGSVRPILAGDPSRGALSLDTGANVKSGQFVQFHHSREEEAPSVPTKAVEEPQRIPSIIFSKAGNKAVAVDDPETNRNFTASSEHGFIVGKPNQQSWICSVSHSSAIQPL